MSVEFSAKPSAEDVINAFETFRSLPQERDLPSAPRRPVQYMPESDRPQPRKDVEREFNDTFVEGPECAFQRSERRNQSFSLDRAKQGEEGAHRDEREVRTV